MAAQAQRMQPATLPRLIHNHLMLQIKKHQADIPEKTGRLKRALLNGGDDIITARTVAVVATDYAVYVKRLRPIDLQSAVDAAAQQMFLRAGYTPRTRG